MSDGQKWVIITGASSGIGRALAFQFAAGGFNLFITAMFLLCKISILFKMKKKKFVIS